MYLVSNFGGSYRAGAKRSIARLFPWVDIDCRCVGELRTPLVTSAAVRVSLVVCSSFCTWFSYPSLDLPVDPPFCCGIVSYDAADTVASCSHVCVLHS